MAKTLLFTATATTLTPGSGGNTFTITDPSLFKSLRLEFSLRSDKAYLQVQNYSADGWIDYLDNNGDPVRLDAKDRDMVMPSEVGTYALRGTIAGTLKAWTNEI